MAYVENKEVMAKNIRRLMNQHDKTRTEVCDDCGFNYQTFSDWVNAKKYPRIDKIEIMAKYFGVQKHELIEDYSDRIYPYNVAPILGTIRAGQPMYADENIEGYRPIPYNDSEKYFYLRVRGDSMNAAGLDDGDLILVRVQPMVEPNQMAVVCVNGFEATVKYFRQEGNMVILSPKSHNPEHTVQIYDLKETPVIVNGRVVSVTKSIE